MTREEFRAELQELILAARPDAPLYDMSLKYCLEKLEDVLYGIRGIDDRPPDVFNEYLGKIS